MPTIIDRRSATVIATLLAVIALAGCGGGGSTTPGSFLFAPQGGTVRPQYQAQNVVQFDYPAGAVSTGVSISATSVLPAQVPGSPAAGGTASALSSGVQVKLGQKFIVFSGKPAVISLPYTAPTPSPANALPPRVYVYRNNVWTVLPAYVKNVDVPVEISQLNSPVLSAEVAPLDDGDMFAVFEPSTPGIGASAVQR